MIFKISISAVWMSLLLSAGCQPNQEMQILSKSGNSKDQTAKKTLTAVLNPNTPKNGGTSTAQLTTCQNSRGELLEACVTNAELKCEAVSGKEFCTQYPSADEGRMWGPF